MRPSRTARHVALAVALVSCTPGACENNCERENWSAAFDLAGGDGGPLAAANDECVVTISGPRASLTYTCTGVVGCGASDASQDRGPCPCGGRYVPTSDAGPLMSCSREIGPACDVINVDILTPPDDYFGAHDVSISVACGGKVVAQPRSVEAMCIVGN